MKRRFFLLGMASLSTPTLSWGRQAMGGPLGPWEFGNVTVEQAWARVNPGSAKTGAIYLTIHNKADADDFLLAVDSAVAKTTAIHESMVQDGISKMTPIPGGLNMPSHGEVVMRPGGIHIMLAGLVAPLKPGDRLPVRMVFRDAGPLDLEVPIIPIGADPAIAHTAHPS